MIFRLLALAVFVTACTPLAQPIDPDTGKPRPSKLNFAYCEKIALETRKAGEISNDLCPGYMPNGYPVELL